ncbi:hypothetical protein BHM03_00050807 [Ensete ventricosum]|nr:hypothetical protein BHM03_00050807 [Ensete ventricosum]
MGSVDDAKNPYGGVSYSLAFGTEVVLPPEVVFSTLRIDNFTLEESEAGLRENLDILKERRAKAHLKNYQRAVARLYNRRVRPQPIVKGDLVLWRPKVSDPGHTRGKLAPRWEGPYCITQVVRDGTDTLSTTEEKTLPQTWHVSSTAMLTQHSKPFIQSKVFKMKLYLIAKSYRMIGRHSREQILQHPTFQKKKKKYLWGRLLL